MVLLWQRESDDAGALYVDLFENISVEFLDKVSMFVKSKNFHRIEKNNELSVDYRNQGNAKFQERKWLEAMNLYNASLCFAEINSENVSLAYANRATCFLRLRQYEKCLFDIELAKKANCPTQLKSELDKRRTDCLKLMKNDDNVKEFVSKLSYEADKNFPGMANVLKIEYNAEFGRHIIAKCDIPAGKTILIDESVVPPSHGMKYNSCTVCSKFSMNFIACSRCTNAIFCNSDCANANDVHKMECEYNLFDAESDTEFFIRSIFVGLSSCKNVDSFMEFVEDAVNDKVKIVPNSLIDMKSKYRAFLQLFIFLTPEKMDKYLQSSYRMYQTLLQLESVESMFQPLKKKRFLMHLVLHHVCVISSNAYRIKGNKTCVSIIQSYLNHACAPNLLSTDDGKYALCLTVRPVKAGKQLFATYFGEFYNLKPNDYCQEYLYETYGFQCKCERCIPDRSSVHSTNLLSDPAFKFVTKEMRKQPTYDYGRKKLMTLQNKCVDLLNRFGGKHWSDELGFIVQSYGTLSEIMNAKYIDFK